VALGPEGFSVNGRAPDLRKFPVPASLSGQSFSVTLGKDEYFVTMVLNLEGHGLGLTAEMASRACIYDRADLLARGVMRWLPVRKRGFLKALE
jgi:hypothetical protein